MFSCKDIDALMMDWLYNELDASQEALFEQHKRSCTHCRHETESLQQIRQQARAGFGSLDELEPPAAITAKLMHEAAKRAPVVPQRAHAGRDDEQSGTWGWFLTLMRPLAAHPGLAAAASFMLLVGVAGSLYWSGKHKFAEPSLDDRAASASPTGAESPAQGPAWREANDMPAESAPEGMVAADDAVEKYAPRDGESALTGYPADLADEATARNLGIAIDQIEPDRKAVPLKALDSTDRRKESLAAAKSGRSNNEAVATRRSSSYSGSDPANAVTGANLRMEKRSESAPADKDAAKADAPAKPKLPSSSSEISSKTRFASPPPPPAPVASMSDSVAQGTLGTAPQAVPSAQSAEASRDDSAGSADEAPASTESSTSASSKEAARLAAARAQERSLRSALNAKRCTEAARIATDLLDTNPSYYSRNIAGLPALAGCQPQLAAERNRRAKARASKAGKAADVQASEPAAPSAK